MPNWYLGAGGVVQTVWNMKHGFDPEHGIKDYDLVYYDANDTSYEGEDVFIQKGKELFKDIAGFAWRKSGTRRAYTSGMKSISVIPSSNTGFYRRSHQHVADDRNLDWN